MKRLFIVLTLLTVPVVYGMEQENVIPKAKLLDGQLLDAAKSGDLEKVKQLCLLKSEKGDSRININARDTYSGTTPLHLAAEGGHKDVALFLLQEGADKEIRDYCYAATPLHWAIRNGDLETVKLFVAQGANLDALNKFRDTPLHVAVFCGKTTVVKFLVEECDANINAVMASKCVPLHYAAYNGHKELVTYLVWHGAKIRASNYWQQTPWMHAQRMKHYHILDFIRQYIVQKQSSFRCPVCFVRKKSDEEALTDYGCLNLICCDCKAILQAREDLCPLCRRPLQ